MATIRGRGDGQYQVQIRRKGWPEQSRTFESRKAAQDWAKVIESEMIRGVFVSRIEAEKTTLHEALERYAREVTSQKKGKAQEAIRIRSWQNDVLASRTLANLRSADFAKFRDQRLANGISPATIRLDLAVISHLFTIAEKEWGINVENPVKKIRLPSVNNARDRRLESGEETRLLAAIDVPAGERSNPWVKPIVLFALETAMRQSEILALDWEFIYFNRPVAHVQNSKNGQARDVPLSPRAVKILKELPRSIGGKVFPTTASALKQSWSRACKRASLEDFHFHDLRHEATTRLAEKFDMHELMKVTGHKDVRMLARYYHPRAEDLAKKLD
jgi:integrase